MQKFNIILIQNLTWHYGYDYLLTGLEELKNIQTNFKAKIVGKGSLYATIRYTIEDLKLDQNVEILNNVDRRDLELLLSKADFYINSTLVKNEDPWINIARKYNLKCIVSNRINNITVQNIYAYPPRQPHILSKQIVNLLGEGIK